MAGISSKAAGGVTNKKKFQGQEFASKEFSDDSGLDIYEFKWRMDDPQIGRFWQVDPLANKYVYNSPYAFSENKVTSHVELEGLEAEFFQWAFNTIIDMNLSLERAGNAAVRQATGQSNQTNSHAPAFIQGAQKTLNQLNDFNALAAPVIKMADLTAKAMSLLPITEAGSVGVGVYTVVSNGAKSSLLNAGEQTVAKALGTRFVTEVEATSFGKVVAKGTVDLEPTFTRIEAGNIGKAFGKNDGIVFQNKEGLLPTTKGVTYKEYVVPTEGIKGAGPMRVIQGSDGSAYFTSNHYESFVQVR